MTARGPAAAADDAERGGAINPPAASGEHALTPGQQRTLDALRRSGDPLVFDSEFIADVRAEMFEAIAHFTDRLGDNVELFVSKHRIATALDCEEQHLVPDPFEWRAANAKGTIAHRAIQLGLTWPGDPAPAELVDEALARIADEERSLGVWINGLGPGDLADVRGQTNERVTQFLEGFPPLQPRWRPLTEASVRWPVDGRITLSGKVDLIFGAPRGSESTKVIVDLKTGRPSPRHRQDLAFYALLETLVRQVPPRKVATFYLDAGEVQAEDVSERLLASAVRRTLDGINALVELEVEQRTPVRRPGAGCRWCPLAAECDDGQRFLTGGTWDDVPVGDPDGD